MNEEMIKRHNEVVKPNDTFYHLGDVIWGSSLQKTQEFLNRLNGKKILIFGNHDDKKTLIASHCFQQYYHYYDFKLDGEFIVLFHYPIEEWNKKFHGSIHLHGHCHNTLQNFLPKRIDIGVDSHNFYPWSWEEIKKECK